MKLVAKIGWALAALLASYLAVAFIAADLNWIRDIWSWERVDRFFLLYATGSIAGVTIGLHSMKE